MVQSVSISSVRPVVRKSTRPEASPMIAATAAARRRPVIGSVQIAVIGEHPDRIGAGAEERGVAERDDARIAEREIERERKQDRHQQLGAEAEIVRKREVARDGEDPGQRLPQPQPMTLDQRARRRMLGRGPGDRAHVVVLPNRPCGRHSSSRMVSAKMNSVPPFGR